MGTSSTQARAIGSQTLCAGLLLYFCRLTVISSFFQLFAICIECEDHRSFAGCLGMRVLLARHRHALYKPCFQLPIASAGASRQLGARMADTAAAAATAETTTSATSPSRMTVDQLRSSLSELGLSTKGHKPDLSARLRKGKKEISGASSSEAEGEEVQCGGWGNGISSTAEASSAPGGWRDDNPFSSGDPRDWQPLYDTYLVIDIEATCEITPWSQVIENDGKLTTVTEPSSRAQVKKLNRDYPNESEHSFPDAFDWLERA